jgi:hypothetical protein
MMRRARTAAAHVFVCVALVWLAATGVAQAQVTTFDGLDAPIVRVNLRDGDIVIRTWDRPTVSVDGDPSLLVERRTTRQSGEPYPLPVPPAQARTAEGPAYLPAESFVVSTIPAGPRDVIFVKSPAVGTNAGAAPTAVTITVPSGSVFVSAHTTGGTLDVHDYRGGTLYATVFRGRISLTNVGGAVFAQSTRGALTVADSSFDRLRARSLTGNVTFERCRARQIEATSVNGSIVYDGGVFEPGLARFESTRGDVAIGTSGPAEIGAHAAGGGRVYTSFDHAVRIDGRAGQTSAVVGGGGPVVNATSQSGNVYLYDGSLRGRGQMGPEWDSPIGALQRPGERPPRTDGRTFSPPPSAAPRKYGRRRNYRSGG